jgi:Uncharacterised protein family (UPF0158)
MIGSAWRADVRGAVYRGDGAALVALLRIGFIPDDALQLIGDGLQAALVQHVDGAQDMAAECARALRERAWSGDDELADQLEAALGTAATPMLRPLAVDLDELANILEGDPINGGGRIDRHTGEVWPRVAIEYARELGEEDEDESEDAERWLWVWCEGSRDAYRDMERFIGTVQSVERADRLDLAIQGRGAFRRFKDVLARWPDELDRWYSFSEERQRGRARAWLADAGYRVASPQQEGKLRP